MSASSVSLRLEIAGPIATLSLARPDKHNALSLAMLREITEVADAIDRSNVAVVVLRGDGPSFSSGFDLTDAARPSTDASVVADADLGRQATEAISELDAVTIAQIHGYCIGGGFVLASACDLRVVAEDAVFSIPEVDLGMPLTWGAIPRLVRELGPAVTRELVLTGRRFTAAEALGWRFANRVVPRGSLDAHTQSLAAEIAAKPRLVTTFTTRQVDAAVDALCSADVGTTDARLLAAAVRARRGDAGSQSAPSSGTS